MPSGIYAGYAEGLLTAPAGQIQWLTGDDTWICLIGPAASQPSQAQIGDAATTTLTELDADLGGPGVYNLDNFVSHTFQMLSATFTVGGASLDYIVDASNTVMTSPDPVTHAEAKDLIMVNGGAGPVSGASLILLQFSLGIPVTPNGQQITVTWNNSGLFKLGGNQL